MNVRTETMDAIEKWKHLGLVLGLKLSSLSVFKINNQGDVEACMLDMLASWLRGNGVPATWQALINALSHPTVEYGELARTLKKKIVERAQNDIN